MAWAGALDGIFQSFTKDFNVVPLNMYRNFRAQNQRCCVFRTKLFVLDPDSVMPDAQLEGDDLGGFCLKFEDSQTEAIIWLT